MFDRFHVGTRSGNNLDFAREIIRNYQETAEWLEAQADAYEAGKARHLLGDVDDSVEMAEMLRHRAGNIRTVIVAVERFALGKS